MSARGRGIASDASDGAAPGDFKTKTKALEGLGRAKQPDRELRHEFACYPRTVIQDGREAELT